MICFSEDLPAIKTANILGINRNTINIYYNLFREKIFEHLQSVQNKFSGEIELDESYFGAKRISGKRGRGATGKTPVFGLLKRDGEVYVEIVRNCSKEQLIPIIKEQLIPIIKEQLIPIIKEQLIPIIKGQILENSTVYTDGWKAYDGLILNSYNHYRIYHSKNEFARGKNHVNGIESFWAFTKRRLAKFNGLKDEKFILHLKESEFRWNHKNYDLNKIIWEIFKRY